MAEYYLKCDKCGSRNPNPSQYTSICKKCNKPLSNSYRNWCTNSSTGPFEEYREQCCEKDFLKVETPT